jgi:phenylpyruvate tautomerase PptA (4-oxalocrotonate tautomerase family)
MPVVSITLLPGYAAETQHRMVNRVANAVRSVIATPEAGTTVFVNEVSTYRRDGKVFSEGRAAHPVASEVVRSFLQAMQERDMGTAQSFLHPDFRMCFPGGVVMHTLQDWRRGRKRATAALANSTNSWKKAGKAMPPWFFAMALCTALGSMAEPLKASASWTESRSKTA